ICSFSLNCFQAMRATAMWPSLCQAAAGLARTSPSRTISGIRVRMDRLPCTRTAALLRVDGRVRDVIKGPIVINGNEPSNRKGHGEPSCFFHQKLPPGLAPLQSHHLNARSSVEVSHAAPGASELVCGP